MALRYGRCAASERLVAALPQGHWRTTSFVAGLRQTGIVAPLVLDGPMTEIAFAYVEQFPSMILPIRGRAAPDCALLPARLNEIDPGEVILEFAQIGALIRVSIMDPKSVTEVVISVRRALARRRCAAPCCASSTMSSAASARSAPAEPACRETRHALELVGYPPP
jgi:hypothetical protein